MTLTQGLGLASLLLLAIHAVAHVRRGTREELLWACNIAALLVGVGAIAAVPALIGVGLMWLLVGFPLWIFDLAVRGGFMPTSIGVHVGCLALALVATARLGLTRGAWWHAALSLSLLRLLSRWLLLPKGNVNLAFEIYPGWQRWFDAYWKYALFLTVVLTAVFFALDVALRLLLRLL